MRFLFTAIWIIILGASCNNNSTGIKEKDEDTTGVAAEVPVLQFHQNFNELYQYLHAQDSSFNPALFEPGALSVKNEEALAITNADLKTYQPYLLYNADSTYALDLVSYNFIPVTKGGKTKMEEQGPDFEVAIIDLKNKTRSRLLFFGASGGSVLDARWKDPGTLLIAGALEWQNEDSLRPAAWEYNVIEKTWQPYHYPSMIRASWSGYDKKLYELNR